MSKSAQLAAATGALLALSLLVLIWSQIQRNREQAALARSTRTEMERVSRTTFPGLAPSQSTASPQRLAEPAPVGNPPQDDVARYWEQASRVQNSAIAAMGEMVLGSAANPAPDPYSDSAGYAQRKAQWETSRRMAIEASVAASRRNLEHYHQVCDPLVTERVRPLHKALGALLETQVRYLRAMWQDLATDRPDTANALVQEQTRFSAASDEWERQKQLLGIR